jgi:hypothetical protein
LIWIKARDAIRTAFFALRRVLADGDASFWLHTALAA